MRTFFALPIDANTRSTIDQWCNRTLPESGRRVPAKNLHITLCFLGRTSAEQLQKLIQHSDLLQAEAFELRIERMKYLRKSGIVWLDAVTIPDALYRLVDALRKIALQARITPDDKPYHPHITLFRRFKVRPPVCQPPLIDLSCNNFVLYQSVPEPGGVSYRPLAQWQLQDSIDFS